MKLLKKVTVLSLIVSLLCPPLLAQDQILITAETWEQHLVLEGSPNKPVVISPLPKLVLASTTRKVIVLPQELNLKEEYQEFRLFRNRYVIFGVYLFTSLYYNWLTRNRR